MAEQLKDPSAFMGVEEKKGRGCFFYGCLTTIVLCIIVGGLGMYGLWRLKEAAVGYTDSEPMLMERGAISPERVERVKEKIFGFYESIQKGNKRGSLRLSEDEVNTLINSHPRFKELGGGVRISFKDEEIKGEVSIPLEGVPLGLGEGKYLNGSAVFKVWAEEGLMVVTIDALKVKDGAVPEMIMAEIRKQNLAKELYKDAEKARMLKRLRRVEVKNGKLVIEVEPGNR
ncbi:hypothetical protein ACFL9T_12560 [Thermodesulfobacteriota bacterium]